MSRARDIADLSSVSARLDTLGGTEGALSNRNLIINGAMQVAQRGTSSTANSGFGILTVDRMYFANSSLDETAITQAQVADAPSNSGFIYSHKATVTTPETTLDGSEWGIWNHKVEAQNVTHLGYGTSGAKSTTLSFWVKSSITGTYAILVFVEDSSPARSIVVNYTISAANTWEYKELSIAGDTGGTGINHDNGTGLDIYWTLSAGPDRKGGTTPTVWGDYAQNRGAEGQTADIVSTNGATWQITGVQLEVGDTATDFEHRSYGDELARCQRYYFQSPSYSAGSSGTGADVILYHTYLKAASNWEWLPQEFPVEMRANPTITTSDGATDGKIGHWTSGGGGSTQGHTPWQVLSKTNHVRVNEYATGSIYGFYYNYKADAEL